MKIRPLIVFAIIFGIAMWWLDAHAAVSTCAISGQVLDGAGNAVPNATIYFNSRVTQIVNSNTIYPILKSASTDANGNLSSVAMAQGLFIQITICQLQGGGCSAPIAAFVPLAASVTFPNLLSGTSTFTGSTLTGILNASGFRITNLGANTTTGDALSQGVSSLNNLAAATGNYAMGSNKLTGLIAGTGSGDSMAYGLNTLNNLAAASGNYAMGSNKLTGLAAGTASGDSMAFGLNHLNDLATATGNYAMGTNKITGLAAPGATGDALSEGHTIGSTTPAQGTFTSLTANSSFSSSGPFILSNQLQVPLQGLSESSGGTLTPNLVGFASDVTITINDNGGWTLANPNIGIIVNDVHWWIRILNTSGGAGGTITLGANYRNDTSWSSTGPANGRTRICPVFTLVSGVSYIGPCTGDETN